MQRAVIAFFMCLFWGISWTLILAVYSQSTINSGLIASTLKFSNVKDMQSGLIFGNGANEVKMLSHPSNGLVIETQNNPLIAFKPDNTIETYAEKWRLVHAEDFSDKMAVGWDNKNPNIVTECAGISMLGGYGIFAKGEVTKKISDLPPHTQLRVKANYHFIDAWIGETGFMRLNIGKDGSLVHVWTDRHNQDNDMLAVNVCGGGTGEGKFAVPIDIAVPHSADSVIVGFGSTIETDDPFDESWGVSFFEVYVK